MNEAIACTPSPVKTLLISAAPLRELLNFLIYLRMPDLLTERSRRQPPLSWEKHPLTIKELEIILRAESRDKNGKLFFNCEKTENHVVVLLDNPVAQLWIHYFRCGIGLVSLSFFSQIASAEGSLPNHTRNVTASHEYQWFTYDLPARLFDGSVSASRTEELGDYFIDRVNPSLISPYSIYFEKAQTNEPYKFITGSLERLQEILTWARFVCEGLKREREPIGKTYVSPHATIHCGSAKDKPAFEHSQRYS